MNEQVLMVLTIGAESLWMEKSGNEITDEGKMRELDNN